MKFKAPSNLQQLRQEMPDDILLECISGSHAYGTAHAESDEDRRGIFTLPAECYLAVQNPASQVSDERGDVVFYSLKRHLELAASANPNALELLFMPEDCFLRLSPSAQSLLEARRQFITRKAFDTHVGYARTQIKKARGRNKWINNPQPEEPPEQEAFCWHIPWKKGDHASMEFPLRPIPLGECDVDLNECHAASLEHAPNVYRLYCYGANARGVFRDGNLVCESIPKDDEQERCIGLLIFNVNEFDKARSDHKHYWEWMRNRNEARWRSQERGEMDYDAKNMMHTFRLLHSGEHILRHGEPLVRFTGAPLEFLKSILAGEHDYDSLIKLAEEKETELKKLHECSRLPDNVDVNFVTNLLREVTELHFSAR